MTNIEFKDWRLTRAHGQGRFLLERALRQCLWFFVPGTLTLLLAHSYWGPEDDFWRKDKYLIWTFAGVSLLIGLGDALNAWRTREREYDRKQRFLHEGSATTSPIPRPRQPCLVTRVIEFKDAQELFPDDALIEEAKSLHVAHSRGLVDLDIACAKFDPIFKMSLAKDTFSLAGRARVCEQAAFLVLMNQYEN